MITRFGLTIFLLFVCFNDFAAAQTDAPPNEGSLMSVAQLPEFRVSIGQVYYERYCLFCHGIYGQGDGMNAFSLPQRPADLQKKVAQQKANINQWPAVIRDGGKKHGLSTAMPAFGLTISLYKIQKITAYLFTLPQRAMQRSVVPDDSDDDDL